MTLQEAKSFVRHLGLSLRQVPRDYRVNFRDGNESDDSPARTSTLLGHLDVSIAAKLCSFCTASSF
jgi:hypothetical protein